MGLDIFFAEDLGNQLAGLERAIEVYPPGEFRDGVAFGLGLVRLSLGLRQETLTIPMPVVITGIEYKLVERRHDHERECSDPRIGR